MVTSEKERYFAMTTSGPMEVSPEEREFVFEWAREWTKGDMFIGSARKACRELGIHDREMGSMIARLYSPQEQCENVKKPIRDVQCPWSSKAEFEERKKLWQMQIHLNPKQVELMPLTREEELHGGQSTRRGAWAGRKREGTSINTRSQENAQADVEPTR